MCVYGALGPAHGAHRIINTTLHLEGFKNCRLGLNNLYNTPYTDRALQARLYTLYISLIILLDMTPPPLNKFKQVSLA